MNFRFKQILRTLAMAGVIGSLAACGGGGGSTQVTKDLAPLAVSASNTTAITAVKAVAASLVGKTLDIGGNIFFDTTTANINPALPTGTVMTFTALPAGAPANALTGFKVENALYVVTGYITPGSGVFNVVDKVLKVSEDDPALKNKDFVVGENYTISDFIIDFDTLNKSVGTNSVPVKITLGNKVFEYTVENATISATGELLVNGAPITTLEFTIVTGAA